MLRSLRFRLPAVFLAGIVLAGLVTSSIAIGLFRSYVHNRTAAELRREARGLSQVYVERSLNSSDEPGFTAQELEEATGDWLFYAGASPFPGSDTGLRRLPQSLFDWQSERSQTFEFKPPGEERTFLGVSEPVKLQTEIFGALVVAKPKAELADSVVTLFRRLALALLAGVAVAGALGWYASRRITQPVLALSQAADEVAGGNYLVDVPPVPGGGEIGQLAERFREMAARLGETEALERNFLMSVSHELRTPLTAIRGHVAALREGVVEDPELRAVSLDVIAEEAGRLERLVGDVLDLAKLDAHRFTVHKEEVDMERVCERAYASFGEEARRRAIDYRSQLSARPVILTDGDRVLQIITNLLANAFRWTPDGGRIGLALAQENGSVWVAVDDSGPGIGPNEVERIFRPFWTRDGGGTGLGLAIARELAHALGGSIALDSAPGRGSRFELVLPAQNAS